MVFFDYLPEVRRISHTTNTIGSLNYSLRKVLKKTGRFSDDESVYKVLYPGLSRVAKKWTMPTRDWSAALEPVQYYQA